MKKIIILTVLVLIGITSSAFAALPTIDPGFAYRFSFYNYEDITTDALNIGEVDTGDVITGIAWAPAMYKLSDPNGPVVATDKVWSYVPGVEELSVVFKTTATSRTTSVIGGLLFDSWTFSVDQFDVYYEENPTAASKFDAEDANFFNRAGTGISGNETLFMSLDDSGLNDAGISNDSYWTSNRIIDIASGSVVNWTFNAGLYVSNPGSAGLTSQPPGSYWKDVVNLSSNPTKKVDFFIEDDIYFLPKTGPSSSIHLAGSEGRITGFATPEPTSMLLFGMGVLGLASSKLRRKKAA